MPRKRAEFKRNRHIRACSYPKHHIAGNAMKKIRLLDIIIVALAGVMLFSGYKVYTISAQAKAAKEQFQQLEQLVQAPPSHSDTTETAPTSQQKYQSVYDANSHFVGWVYIPDTALSYPVVQTTQNPEYYLRRDFEGKYSIHGVPFVDYRCVVDQSDNTIIYGHNMMNGTMFSILENYADKSYWQQHQYIGFDTMNGYGSYQIAICARVDLQAVDFNYTDSINFADAEQFDSYIQNMKSLACYETDVELCYGDRLLVLSTCQTNNDNGRYVIVAKKVGDTYLLAD